MGKGTIKLRGRMEKCHGRTGRWEPEQVPAGVWSPGASDWALRRRLPALQGSGLSARSRARRRGGRRAG